MQSEENNSSKKPRKKGKLYAAIVVVLIAMFTIPLGYNKTGYELLHAYQRYVRRKSELKEYSVRDTIQTFEKFLEVELAVDKKIQQMEDSARQARSSGQGRDSQ